MLTLVDRQKAFGRALFEPGATMPHGLVVPTHAAASRRFAVYRNNVAVGLIDALRDAFPAVERIVGGECFAAVALAFARAHPPATPVMLDYGAAFPSFLERQEVSTELPYLADVARCERAWVEAFHAADAAPLEAGDLLRLEAGDVQALQLAAHPSLRLVRSSVSALTIWEMNVGRRALAPFDFAAAPENALFLRPHAQVLVEPLSEAAAEFLCAVAAGDLLCDAFSRACHASPAFDAAAEFGRLLDLGAFAVPVRLTGRPR